MFFPSQAETEEARRIDMLHREIETCEKEIADKNHYARKLEHMLGRLRSNQVSETARGCAVDCGVE